MKEIILLIMIVVTLTWVVQRNKYFEGKIITEELAACEFLDCEIIEKNGGKFAIITGKMKKEWNGRVTIVNKNGNEVVVSYLAIWWDK